MKSLLAVLLLMPSISLADPFVVKPESVASLFKTCMDVNKGRVGCKSKLCFRDRQALEKYCLKKARPQACFEDNKKKLYCDALTCFKSERALNDACDRWTELEECVDKSRMDIGCRARHCYKDEDELRKYCIEGRDKLTEAERAADIDQSSER